MLIQTKYKSDFKKYCKSEIEKYDNATYLSGAIWWPILQLMQVAPKSDPKKFTRNQES